MGILDQARIDTQRITTDLNGWAVAITFTDLEDEVVTINGLHTKHHLGIDTDGNMINSKNAHISFSELEIDANGYVIRNSNQEVSLKNKRVTVKDSTGIAKDYVIKESYPDETIGLIVCILGDFE